MSSSASYDSFGNATGNLTTRYQFTGREYDSFTGLHYYRARFYDGKLGRFISEDPIGFSGGDVNQFGYVKNNPLFYKDPLGLITNPYYSGCVGGYTALGASVGFYAGGGVGLLGGLGAVATSPLGAIGGTAIGGALGAGIGTLACGTPPFPNQADALPNTPTLPFPNAPDKTTCDVKPKPIPRFIPPDDGGRGTCFFVGKTPTGLCKYQCVGKMFNGKLYLPPSKDGSCLKSFPY